MINIGIVYTGGTIGGIRKETVDERHTMQSLVRLLYQNRCIPDDCEIECKNPVNKFSECMLPQDWVKIAEAVKELSMFCKGVIVLHGTDTLCYTASALAFMLMGSSKRVPVMVTGSNAPLEDADDQASQNVRDCFTAIASDIFKGVYVCFAGEIHIATVARKVAIEGNSFASMNGRPAGRIIDEKVDTGENISPQWGGSYIPNGDDDILEMDSDVGYYKIYPGFKAELIANDTSKAMILEMYNDGTGPCGLGDRYCLGENIAKFGKPVFATSQHNCSVELSTYSTSVELAKSGIVGLEDMLSETAIVKLMWLLGRGMQGQELIDAMKTDYCYELFGFFPFC